MEQRTLAMIANCPELFELEHYATGEADAGATGSIDQHLGSCGGCRQRLEDVKSNLQAVGAIQQALNVQPVALSGQQVGQYEIVEELGRGGMGVVYKAHQRSPRRWVALKVMHVGLLADSPHQRMIHREAQALARLQHPAIAVIYEAGVVSGRPFIAMELVEGAPLTAWTTRNDLSIPNRLRLFSEVCRAVNFAHSRGVIHRDLKPSNILVDGHGRPHILDFGLAKLVEVEDEAALTRSGRMLGTIPYMSPEQVHADVHDIDTRSDVYALGVILYELLSGRLPYDLPPANLVQAARIISECRPKPASHYVPQVAGDLDVIVMKALEKDPAQRYQSAAALYEDITRYLNNQPILVRPPSTAYLVGKMIQRHRAASALIAVFALLIVGMGVVSMVQALRLSRRSEALAASRTEEAAARLLAEQNSATAQAVSVFLQDMLESASPETGVGQDVTVREVLDQAAREIDAGSFAAQPAVEAGIRHTLGNTYRSLAVYDQAEYQLKRAADIRRALYPHGHADLAMSLHKLARVLEEQGRFMEAEKSCRAALNMRRDLPGDHAVDISRSLNNLGYLRFLQGDYPQAEQLQCQVLDMRVELLGEEHTETSTALNNLAVTLTRMGRHAEAEELLRRSLALEKQLHGARHPNTISTMNNLAAALMAQGAVDQAEELIIQAVDLRRQVLPQWHPRLAADLTMLARVLHRQGRLDEARAVAREALEIYYHSVDRHPAAAATMNLLGLILADQGDFSGAEQLHKEAVELQRSTLGVAHPETLLSLYYLGTLYVRMERCEEALPLLADAVAGADDAVSAPFLSAHGNCLICLERYAEAEASLLKAYDTCAAQADTNDSTPSQAAAALVELYTRWDKPQQQALWQDRATAEPD